MAKDYSAHQQRIIRNYYKNLDGIRAQRLQELVTELWLAGTDEKRERLWARAEEHFNKTYGIVHPALAHLVGREA